MTNTSVTDVTAAATLSHEEAMRLQAVELERTLELLRELDDVDWSASTDCPDWDVRRMYLHVLGACEAAASLTENLRQLRAAWSCGRSSVAGPGRARRPVRPRRSAARQAGNASDSSFQAARSGIAGPIASGPCHGLGENDRSVFWLPDRSLPAPSRACCDSGPVASSKHRPRSQRRARHGFPPCSQEAPVAGRLHRISPDYRRAARPAQSRALSNGV